MPRALEERMHTAWTLLKEKEFRNKKVRATFKKLDDLRMLSWALINELNKKQTTEAYAEKQRLVFQNEFEYLPEVKGEYLLLTRDLLSIFAKRRLPVFVGDFPIFVHLKTVPVFWINGGIITLWYFYFPEMKIKTAFEEVIRFSNKIAVFPRLEFASFNFIQTYSSTPGQELSFDNLRQKNPRVLEVLEKYLTKNFWMIPKTNIKDASPLSFVFFGEDYLLPCIPYRIVFKVLEIRRVKTISFLNKELSCLELLISYLNASGNTQRDIVYLPRRLIDMRPEKGKIYNSLLFTLVDLEKEWIYPILFSFYEEDLRSYEIFQELLLLFFRNRYIESENPCSINFDEEEFWNEMNFFTNVLWKGRMLPYSSDMFWKLDKKNIIEILFAGLYPVFVKSNGRMFYVPPPISLLNIEKDRLIRLVKDCDIQLRSDVDEDDKIVCKYRTSAGRSFSGQALIRCLKDNITFGEDSQKCLFCKFSEISDIMSSLSSYQEFLRDLKQKSLFMNYLKQLFKKDACGGYRG